MDDRIISIGKLFGGSGGLAGYEKQYACELGSDRQCI